MIGWCEDGFNAIKALVFILFLKRRICVSLTKPQLPGVIIKSQDWDINNNPGLGFKV